MRAGLVMLAATALALVLANSPAGGWYRALIDWPLQLWFGDFSLRKPLLLWVNEALMAAFFLLVGIEIKREFSSGLLQSAQQAVMPLVAAVGGVLVPAGIFIALIGTDTAAADGWAIPCATDIAFSLVMLRLVAPQAPPALALVLTAVAVIDDLAAILIIALFFAAELSTLSLVAACGPLLALVILNRRAVQSPAPYLIAGALLWLCVLKSGVHATMAGVITALAMPAASNRNAPVRIEHALKPWVDYGVLPLFAFFNAGVALGAVAPDGEGPAVIMAIACALLIGKSVGVVLGMALGTRVFGGVLPQGLLWRDLWGMSALAGIGFTMSLFIASLAYETADPALFDAAKIGVLAGSALSVLLGAMLLAHRRR
jgi:NhaA family Na+:H+ antiporter